MDSMENKNGKDDSGNGSSDQNENTPQAREKRRKEKELAEVKGVEILGMIDQATGQMRVELERERKEHQVRSFVSLLFSLPFFLC
jgi:hypothetical protein